MRCLAMLNDSWVDCVAVDIKLSVSTSATVEPVSRIVPKVTSTSPSSEPAHVYMCLGGGVIVAFKTPHNKFEKAEITPPRHPSHPRRALVGHWGRRVAAGRPCHRLAISPRLPTSTPLGRPPPLPPLFLGKPRSNLPLLHLYFQQEQTIQPVRKGSQSKVQYIGRGGGSTGQESGFRVDGRHQHPFSDTGAPVLFLDAPRKLALFSRRLFTPDPFLRPCPRRLHLCNPDKGGGEAAKMYKGTTGFATHAIRGW